MMFATMKTILFLMPIFYVVHVLYVRKFGIYSMDFDLQGWFAAHANRAGYAIGIFALIYVGAVIAEEYVIPAIGLVFAGEFKDKSIKEYKKAIMPFLYRIAPKEELREMARDLQGEMRIEFNAVMSFIPVTFLLWVLWLSVVISWWYVTLAFVVLLFHWWIMRMMNTTWRVLAK
mgnify:CR=1 FL=1